MMPPDAFPPQDDNALAATPWRVGFFSLMRQLAARYPDAPPIGQALRPQEESFRVGQKPSLIFAPREIADITRDPHGYWRIRLFSLGLLGPNGAMPLFFTEFVRERSEAHQDSTLADFLDIFHHRALTTFYRAWAISQSAIALDRPQDEHFSSYIDALGHTASSHPAALASHARLSAAPHLVREARNPEGLTKMLKRFFDVPVAIEEFIPRWVDIHPDDCTRLGDPCLSSLLGEGAFAGEKIMDCQHNFRLLIGPLPLDDYLSFTPTGHNLPKLVEWVRAFIGFEFLWEVKITVSPNAAPPAHLGGHERLGWSTWLGQPKPEQPVTGMVFEPERQSARYSAA